MTGKEIRAYYMARGRCPECSGKRFMEPGYTTCPECRALQSKRDKARRKRRDELGLCTECGGERDDPSLKTCSKCRAKKRAYREYVDYGNYQKRFTAQLKANFVCIRCCKREAEPGHVYCKACAEKRKKNDRKYDPTGEKKRAMRQRRIEAGLCYDCSRPTDGIHTRCKRCRKMRMDSVRKYNIKKRIAREAQSARRNNANV